MTKDRQIVLALIKRARRSRQRLLKTKQTTPEDSQYLSILSAIYSEAHNIAEFARRILYDIDL